MKQENRFVAELFHYLSPFIDRGQKVFVCVDGGAATHHAGREGAALSEPDVPDLWFTFVGQAHACGIEAKVLDGNCISFRRGQLQAWRSIGSGKYCPKFWVATDRDLERFFCWRHATMLPRLDSTTNTVKDVNLSIAKYPPDFQTSNLAELALYILALSGDPIRQ
jgi:hypothetical protein